MRLGASLLVLLIADLANGALGAARAASPGQMGAASKGSISISVSVRPQVQLSHIAAVNGLGETVIVGTGSTQHICLLASATSGSYSVLLQPSGDRLQNERPAALSRSEAATSICRSGGVAGSNGATGFRLPLTDPRRPVPYTLLIAAE